MSLTTIQQPAPTNQPTTTAMAVSRQSQEVQAAMIVAKQYPRDETQALQRILNSCKRKSLAQSALYSYPKGGTRVTGPSIRLAEAMAQGWGNLDFGVIELEQNHGESVAMSYCWDLETNVRQTKIFTVKHIRGTREGNKLLTDPRDIYELVANQGARRLRSCILGVIPGDIQDLAVEQVNKSLTSGHTESLQDRIRKMVLAFAELSVSQEMIEEKLGYKVTACVEQDFVTLRSIYMSIKDGFDSRDTYFSPSSKKNTGKNPDSPPAGKPKSRTEALKQKLEPADKGEEEPQSTEPVVEQLRQQVLAASNKDELSAAYNAIESHQADLSGEDMDELGKSIDAKSTELGL